MNPPESSSGSRAVAHLRALGLLVSAGCATQALLPIDRWIIPSGGPWWWLLASFAAAVVSMVGVDLGLPEPRPRAAATRRARILGLLLALAGTVAWLWATRAYYLDWYGRFDDAWLTWVGGTLLLATGFDLASGAWSDRETRAQTRAAWLSMLVLLGLGGAVRLLDITTFPGPDGMTQIEDLQFGNWGAHWLDGQRRRWEFIGHAWISALGITLGGPTLASMRIAYAVVGTLAVGATFLWLRASAGWLAAAIGGAFLVVSSWDAVVARIGFNPNILTVAVIYWLLMGPARRGRPSAYAFMGLASGYLLWEYIAYRPAVAFALFGAFWFSLRDVSSGWLLRIGRPLLMLSLIVCMSIPLFGTRMRGRVANEYLNGLNRARAEKAYYNDAHSWQKSIDMRLDRSLRTVGLFFFEGDRAGTRNVARRPLVDHATSYVAMLGLAVCLAHPFASLLGVFAVAFVVTSIGAMVVTADFNVLRMSVTIPYVYFFVGVGGAAVVRVWTAAWGQWGRGLALLSLVAALAWAATDNLRFLEEYHESPTVRAFVRSDLARLCGWLGENVRDGEQVIGSANRFHNALIGSDAAWLRAGDIPGVMEWDIQTALEKWEEDLPTVLVVYGRDDTVATGHYLDALFPELDVEVVPDPLQKGGEIAFGRLPGRPEGLDDRLAEANCRGVSAHYLLRRDGPEPIRELKRVQPLIGHSTWPSEVAWWPHKGLRAKSLEIRYRAEITVREAGMYTFHGDVYGSSMQLTIDGKRRSGGRFVRVQLSEGVHDLRAVVKFPHAGGGVKVRLLWKGPDTGRREVPLPFYEVGTPVPGCAAGAGAGATSDEAA